MKSHWPRLREPRGFTAVELIVALLILAGLAAIFIPALGRTEPRKSVSAAKSAFASLHATARATAIQYGRTTRIRVQAPSRIWIAVTTSAGTSDTVGDVLYLDRSFNRVTVTSDRATLCYGPRGLPVQTAGCDPPSATLIFTKNAAADTVRISAAGRLLR